MATLAHRAPRFILTRALGLILYGCGFGLCLLGVGLLRLGQWVGDFH